MSKVKALVDGKEHVGTVTDADRVFFLGLLFMDAQERDIMKSRGSQAALTMMGPRLEKLLEDAVAQKKKDLGVKKLSDAQMEEVNNLLYQGLGEGVFNKVNSDREIRLSFVQRVLEIFPDLPSDMVSYQRYLDSTGNTHEKGSIRLSMEDIMNLTLVCLKEVDTEKVEAEKDDLKKEDSTPGSFADLVSKLSPEQIRMIKESK